MDISKKIRLAVYNKFDGHCAYCGCELIKGWHIDEIKPVIRNRLYNKDKKKWMYDGTYKFPERLNIDNQYPSCPSCNINKHQMSIEQFRAQIKGFVKSLNERSVQYQIAKRYGLIQEIDTEVVFYFERIKIIEP